MAKPLELKFLDHTERRTSFSEIKLILKDGFYLFRCNPKTLIKNDRWSIKLIANGYIVIPRAYNLSGNIRKRIFGHARPEEIQISLRSLIRIFTGRISLGKDSKCLHADPQRLLSTVALDCANAQADLKLRRRYVLSRCGSFVLICTPCQERQ